MSSTQIYILSQPIQSGKTTLLQRWITGKKCIGGFLTPDIDGVRKLLDISTNTYHTHQLADHEDGIQIGRFVFDSKGFEIARQLLLNCTTRNDDWVIVDEIGRLELDRHEGLEPVLSTVLDHYKTHVSDTKLLLVVRDYLLKDVQKHYGLESAIVLPPTFFESDSKLTGVVLCGGQSVRMGRDKAFIQYHSTEQYIHIAETMKPICDEVLISCNQQQETQISFVHKTIIDSATFVNAGPMSGVLSVFAQLNESAILVVGCDYPYFTTTDMTALLEAREPDIDVVCYHNPESGFDEPLLAVYEKQCASLLLSYYQKEHSSLRHFLQTVRTKRLDPDNLLSVKSIDLPDQYK